MLSGFPFRRLCNGAKSVLENKIDTTKYGIARKKYNGATHCIFDMDGTVLDTETTYHKLIAKLCDKHGRVYTKDLEKRVYGATDREACVTVVKELKLPISVDEFELQLTDLCNKTLPSSPLQKGAERLLTHLFDHKVPMALATNSTEQAVRLHAMARPKLFGMFHHKVSSTDPEILRGKPHPDIFLLAASRFPKKPKPKECLVFEDSPAGVVAAKEAGMQVVMIQGTRSDRDYARQATLVIKSLLEFKPELFGLPPFPESKGTPKLRRLEDDPPVPTDDPIPANNKNK